MWTYFATSTAYALSSLAYVATVGIPPADRGAVYSAADVLLTFDLALLGWLGVDRADVVGGDDRVGGGLDRLMRRPSFRRAYAAMDTMVPYTAPAAGGL